MEFLSLSRRRSSTWNVPTGEERGETDVFAGYLLLYMVVCIWVRVCARVCVSLCLFSLFFPFFVISILYENVRNSFTKNSKKKKNVALAFTSSCYCVRGTRTQPLISVGCSVLLISENLRFRLCPHTFASLWGSCLRFASLWRTNSHGDSCVLGVHLSNFCWGLLFCLRKAFTF